MTRIPSSKIVIGTLVLGVLGSTAIYAQEKYSDRKSTRLNSSH